MVSAISFMKPFSLCDHPLNQFFSLGSPAGNRGIQHTAYLSKKVRDKFQKFNVLTPTKLNGFCSYAFIVCTAGLIYGFLVITPLSQTVVKHHALVVGGESEVYTPLYHLQPQNVLIMESSSSNLVLLSTKIDSPMLVPVDL